MAKNLPPRGCTAEEAQQYTRWLAKRHYENFKVVSWLLPRRLRQHFYNVYAYCRWSDDLGDEVPDRGRALELLDAWDTELAQVCAGTVERGHAVLIALRETIREKEIPLEPFRNLLKAFRQDQIVQRYPTWGGVLDYCVNSANPVGRIVLYVCGYRDEERQHLSDFTCTALQLANFWQDVSLDREKGRIYIPLEELARHGLVETDITEKRFDGRYVELMKTLIARTRNLFAAGMPLAKTVEPYLQVDLEMFSRGGMAILDAIERQGYSTLVRRPTITKWTQAGLLVGTVFRTTLARGSKAPRATVPVASDSRAVQPGSPRVSANWSYLPEGSSEVYRDEVRVSYAECNRIARGAKSSFYLAFFGLPRQKRNGLCALYAFMRLVDNVSDDPGGVEAKRSGLVHWRSMLDETIAGKTDAHPILPALADTISRFEIPTRYFHDLILGAEMDLTIPTYATFDRLSEYCYRVAGTVGLTCLHVFGFRDPRAPDLAERLGLAFQLTNILRDVRADFEIGRTYLPQEDLKRFDLRGEEVQGPLTPRLQRLLEFEAERAWECYEEGTQLINLVNPDSRATLWALVRTYSALLARIEERGFDVFSERISLTHAEKVQFLFVATMSGWWKKDALAKRIGDRRRVGGTELRRRAS
jgi:squalene synthase HpnC